MILVLSNGNMVNGIPTETENPCAGAYLDQIIYTEMTSESQRITALMSADADLLQDAVDTSYLSTLELESDIDVHSLLENGMRYIDINCGKYPLNITGFRRALAYAFNKTKVVSDVMDDHAIVHDSIVSSKEDWCIEEELPWHYYSDQTALGNQILDGLNFVRDGVTGFRNAPDGSPFSVYVAYLVFDDKSQGIAQRAVDALRAMDVNAETYADDHTVFGNVVNHGDYDMYVYKQINRDLAWILDNYYSLYSSIAYTNPSNYENATFDSLRELLINAPNYEDFFEVVSDIQKHIHENVPVLVACHEIDYQAFRNTDFTGHVEDEYWGVSGPWTNVKVHNLAGNPFGGVFDIAIYQIPFTFNMFLTDLPNLHSILSNLYSGAYKMGPDGALYLDLAEEVLVETHSTNAAIPTGQTWVTVEVRDGVTWSDGAQLDAEDVAFTFTYLYESGLLGNPSGNARLFDDFLVSETLSPNTARLKFSKSSYYTTLSIEQLLLSKIIPEHIFNEATGIGYAGWSSWNPVLTTDPFITCGPFYVSDYDSLSLELSRNLDYHWPSGLAPQILSANDVTYVQGSTGNQIVWEVTDEDPDEYTIFRDGSQVTTNDWNGSDIIHNVDGLSVGEYNYTLVLTDLSGHIVTDMVWVTVTGAPGGIPDLLTTGVIAGSIVVILIVGVAFYKKR
ncbi:MAG: ABC transporter substrate-binding protein [Candidatus Thorarchaeota archaeon]